jgi:hypothetical protein
MLPASLKRYAWLSIVAALATILLKGWAWWLTGSVGLLSDALESFVNLAGAMMALAMLTLAARPADENHAHGHGKAEYFSSAFEGVLILVAADRHRLRRDRTPAQSATARSGGHRAGGVGGCLDHQPGHLARSSWGWARNTDPSPWKPTPIICSPTSGPPPASSSASDWCG